MSELTIFVRSRVRSGTDQTGSPTFCNEWTKKVHSWKKAWSIVSGCGEQRQACHLWSLDHNSLNRRKGYWYCDLGGEEEMKAKRQAYSAALEKMGI